MQKQRKKTQKERKKKEREEEEEEEMEISSSRPKPRQIQAGDTGRTCRSKSRATVSGFFFFFFSDEHVGATLVVFFFVFFLNVNRVLETRFSYRCHVEKVPHQTRITHKNRAFEARVAKNPYSL